MKKYETVFVLNATLDEAATKEKVEAVNAILTSNGAKVLDCAIWGKKELAYEIDGQKYGYYVVTTFEAENSAVIDEFNRLVLIDKTVLRHIVVNAKA